MATLLIFIMTNYKKGGTHLVVEVVVVVGGVVVEGVHILLLCDLDLYIYSAGYYFRGYTQLFKIKVSVIILNMVF